MKNSGKNDEGFCVKCGTCNTVCPVYLATGNEINTPRGKQHLGAGIAKGEVSSHYAEIFSQCLLCGACLEACPRDLDTPALVIGVRAELPKLSGLSFLKFVSRRALLHPSLFSGLARMGAAANTLLGERLPENSGLRLRLQGFAAETFTLPPVGYIEKLKSTAAGGRDQQEREAQAGLSFFAGCLANHLQPEIAEATQYLAARTTGSDAAVPVGQTCCGMAALAAGRKAEARDLAKKNILAFEENDLPILTSCSSCYYQLKTYTALLGDDAEWRRRAVHFTERLREFSTFFLEKFSADRDASIRVGARSARKVFYHDPCHLRFKLHITEEPRQLIRMLPGIELEELPDGPRCCGQGGLFQVAHPDLSLRIRNRLMTDFGKLDAPTVLTTCSGCLLQWRQGLAAGKQKGKAEHLAIFIAGLLR